MLLFLADAWNLFTLFFMWLTLIAAFAAACIHLYRVVKKAKAKEKYLKNAIILLLSSSYLALFVWMRYENFESLFAVLFMLYAVICTQLQKYEDRKSGKRWWTH